MAKRVFYIYNPTTDDFERYYPTFKSRLIRLGKYALAVSLLALLLIWLLYFIFGLNNESYIKKENRRLKDEVKILNGKVDESLKIMSDISARDDNFYRVMLQMEPVNRNVRIAGQSNRNSLMQYQGLSDADMLIQLNRNIELLNRQLYAQSLSFDELREEALKQRNKIDHVPAILPLEEGSFRLSCGYGYRMDPLQGGTRFHTGIDLVAYMETPVFATAAGTVVKAASDGTEGNSVEIDHGFNYRTIYSHLGNIQVKEGDKLKRGDRIGTTGNSGRSTAPHLHYEVKFKDAPVDPVNYYFLDITPEKYRDFVESAANAGNMMD